MPPSECFDSAESALPPVRVANTPRLPIPSIDAVTVTLLRDLTLIYATAPVTATLTMASFDVLGRRRHAQRQRGVQLAVRGRRRRVGGHVHVERLLRRRAVQGVLVEVAEQQPGQVAADLAEQVAAAVDLGEHAPLHHDPRAGPDRHEVAGVRQVAPVDVRRRVGERPVAVDADAVEHRPDHVHPGVVERVAVRLDQPACDSPVA
jgi:hypothetical protein